MDTQTQISPLTADDVKALKTADRIVFRYHKGVMTIEAGLERRGEDVPIYTAAQQRLFPATGSNYNHERERDLVVSGSLRWYEGYGSRPGSSSASAFAMIGSAQYDDVWKTIVGLLKVGDEIHLSFVGDAHSNGYTKDAGLHADALRLVINRGSQRLTFNVAESVCAANSARMVKPHGV